MTLLHRKGRLAKMVDSIESNDILRSAAITAAESALAGATSQRQAEKLAKALSSLDSGKAKRNGSMKGKAKTALLVGAGTAAAIAASSSISAIRRREKGKDASISGHGD